MRRGLYRVRGAGGLPDDVRVEDDGIEMPLEESLYRARGYLPRVESLPWQEEYLTAKPIEDPGDGDRAARERAREDFRSRFRKP